MRWLTREWGEDANEAEYESTWDEYEAHLDRLLRTAPPDLVSFARRDDPHSVVHDSKILAIRIDTAARQIGLDLLQDDDPPVGYGVLSLTFRSAEWTQPPIDRIAAEVTADADVLWEEIDEGQDGRHRWRAGILLWPVGELTIDFDDFGKSWRPLPVGAPWPDGINFVIDGIATVVRGAC